MSDIWGATSNQSSSLRTLYNDRIAKASFQPAINDGGGGGEADSPKTNIQGRMDMVEVE